MPMLSELQFRSRNFLVNLFFENNCIGHLQVNLLKKLST